MIMARARPISTNRRASKAPLAMPQLSEGDWARLTPLLKNMDAARQQAAYNRLVVGMTYAAAGAPFGYSRQDVSYLVRGVLRWWERLCEVPDKSPVPRGWVRLEFVVPRRKATEIRHLVEAALQSPAAAKVARKGTRSSSAGSKTATKR